MVTPIENVLSRLEGVQGAGKRFKARCPAHLDKTPSLSIKEGDDGRALIHCFGGCKVEAVAAALGLRLSDLFYAENAHYKTSAMGGVSRRELMKAAETEMQILFIAKADQLRGRTVSQLDLDRVKIAQHRVSLARRIL